ncbi:MAG: glycosyltransferase family 2 protein [Planctomycetaceae bacterium]|nr:glycosyltransferase family 2 protein [Planctomycetaceae bacterium]
MKLSIVIPAYNEEQNVGPTLDELRRVVKDEHGIAHEVIVVNDNSRDSTRDVILAKQGEYPEVRLVDRRGPGGFGRAIRSGLDAVCGDVVVICMADLSDDPQDVVAYYRKICEGYDCVFGSRFIKGSRVENYPRLKLVVNRIVNTGIRLLFGTKFNDLSNAFKAYRTTVLQECGPFRSSHFNVTLELSLSALIRDYNICQIPIRWYGRTWGASNLRLREMGRRYLCTALTFFFQRMLIRDDLMVERLAQSQQTREQTQSHRAEPSTDVEARLTKLEELMAQVDTELQQQQQQQSAAAR